MINGKSTTAFEDFESDDFDFKRYQNLRLIRLLEGILAEKGELTQQDLQNAYEKWMVLSQEDLELISKNWCFLRKSGDHSVNNSKCCLTQLGDAAAVKRDAVQLANYMHTYLVFRLSEQPENKRIRIYTYLKIVCLWRSQIAITSGDRSTFAGVFQLLGSEMNGFDKEMYGENFKLKPALESFLLELAPIIILRMNKYSEDSSLGVDECQICNSCRVEASDIKTLSFFPYFKTQEELESFLAETFRETFYTELVDYLADISCFFSEDGKMN